jgi:hypothetical protein
MRRDENGVGAAKLFDELSNGTNLVWIQADGWLIQNNQLRFMHERIGQSNALPITFGKVTDDFFLHVGQSALLHNDINSFA